MIRCYHVAWQPPKITIDMLIIWFKVEAAVPLGKTLSLLSVLKYQQAKVLLPVWVLLVFPYIKFKVLCLLYFLDSSFVFFSSGYLLLFHFLFSVVIRFCFLVFLVRFYVYSHLVWVASTVCHLRLSLSHTVFVFPSLLFHLSCTSCLVSIFMALTLKFVVFLLLLPVCLPVVAWLLVTVSC